MHLGLYFSVHILKSGIEFEISIQFYFGDVLDTVHTMLAESVLGYPPVLKVTLIVGEVNVA